MNTEKVIIWIKEERAAGTEWDKLYLANKSSKKELEVFLQSSEADYHWPAITVEQWRDIIDRERKKEDDLRDVLDEKGVRIIRASNEINETGISEEEESSWQTYRRKILVKGFSLQSVDAMEDASLKVLRMLSTDTRAIGPVKGLVVGNVQSGKTANMAALIAMAADAGWNMFVVLSGMTTNLRYQTIERLMSDLDDSKFQWRHIDNPSARSQYGDRLRDLALGPESNSRYLCACIKNKDRLKGLLNWFSYDENARANVRMLIIDDECDQASINTSTNDRTEINNLILRIINNYRRPNKDLKCEVPLRAVNYIGYTATPYANVLNEAPGEDSLYPQNFICTLPVSDEYFGPQQIFGLDGVDSDSPKLFPGLDIVRTIPEDEIERIVEMHKGNPGVIPATMKDAICWFLCGVAYMRSMHYSKPVSMLVHTSGNVAPHGYIEKAISYWLNTGQHQIIDRCRKLWVSESGKLNVDRFLKSYPDYAKTRGNVKLKELPEFDSIKPELNKLLGVGIRHILVDSDDQITYSTGIHLCVDNSEKPDNGNVVKRLIYPKSNEMPCKAPAFIVVGGNTLSRGLTIEGLVSTFFLRDSKTADTLMQMGRWFGYRRGYELLPRIWMSKRTKERFQFMSEMDYKLREEIKKMAELNMRPDEAGPKIMTSPSANFLQIAAYNKIRGAQAAEYDFAGHTMETGVFRNSERELKGNLKKSSEFIAELGHPDTQSNSNPLANGNYIWRNVAMEKVMRFLSDYKYSPRLKGFNDMEALSKWLTKSSESGMYGSWNVVLVGKKIGNSSKTWTPVEGVTVGMVNRTRRFQSTDGETMNIGVLRSFNDFLSDIPVDSKDIQLQEELRSVDHNLKALNEIRKRAGLESTPQLLIYVIDKDSKPNENNQTNRLPLDAKEDVVGFSINIPGFSDRKSTVQSITIKLKPKEMDEPDIQEV